MHYSFIHSIPFLLQYFKSSVPKLKTPPPRSLFLSFSLSLLFLVLFLVLWAKPSLSLPQSDTTRASPPPRFIPGPPASLSDPPPPPPPFSLLPLQSPTRWTPPKTPRTRRSGFPSPRSWPTVSGGGSTRRSRRPAPAIPLCRFSSARCIIAAMASPRMTKRQGHGLKKHLAIDHQFGRSATKDQDIMQVTLILMRSQIRSNQLMDKQLILVKAWRESFKNKNHCVFYGCSVWMIQIYLTFFV